MQMEKVSVDQLLEDALASAVLLARPFEVRLESKISAYGQVLGDAARLHQLLGILVDNAVRHSDRGAGVAFEAEVEARHLVLRVRDHGPGIPEDELTHIFERFYRGRRDRQAEGSGLGLAIARWIVEEHRGQITVRSAAGVGSEFTVVLPLLPAERRVPMTRAVEAGGEPAPQIE
jgi:signal transduction histidine kinase